MTELVTVWHGALWRDDRPVVIPPPVPIVPRRLTTPAERRAIAAKAAARRWGVRLSHPRNHRFCRTCGIRWVQWKGECRRCLLGQIGGPR